MTTNISSTTDTVRLLPRSRSTVLRLLANGWNFNRLLTLATVLHVVIIPLLFLGMVIDPKVITGVNGWIKPLKFAISGAIYCGTFLWLLTYIPGRRRWVQSAANVTGLALIVETALITMQVVRGTTSHFNVSTAFDATVFSIMGTFILLLAMMNLSAGVLLSVQRMGNRVFAWALRFGVLISLVGGMMAGFLMTDGPTPEQLAQAEATGVMAIAGAHSVGVTDGGSGLPFVGWSMEGGDLRVPHFVGLHAMQVLPLLGWLLTRRRVQQRLREGQRLAFVWVASLGYLSWTALLTWQALRGQSIVAPDAATWTAYGVLAGVILLASGIITYLSRPRPDAGVILENASSVTN